MKHFSSHFRPLKLWRPLLLAGALATAGAAQAQTPTFAPVATYSAGTGSSPRDVAAADLNGDGRLDLVTANTGSNSVGVLLGSANGLFATAVTYATGNSPISVAVADINGDGKLDVVTANQASNTVGVLLGTGSGTLQPMTAYPSGSRPSSIAVADVDGDSRPDILTANTNDNAVGVLFSRGGVAFSSNTNYPAGNGSSITSISVAYVNRDNILDVVTASPANGTAGVLLGSQTFSGGSFSLLGNYPAGRNPVDIAVADVNGDGNADLLTAGYGGHEVGVLLGSGNGTFPTVVSYPISASPEAIGVADVNGDGQLDLVTTNEGSTASLLVGTGTGTFQASITYATSGGSAQPFGKLGIAIADVNGDGKLDLLTADATAVGVLLNTTATTAQAPTLITLNPTNGPVGTSVTLTGTALTGVMAVSFNGTAATTFAVVNATTVTATVPTGATSGNVTVTTAQGISNGVAFTVTPPTTAAPVLNALSSPSYGPRPTYSGTAAAGSTVRVYVDGALLSTTTTATLGGTFSLVQPTPLVTGSHTVYATAQASGATVSANSSTLTFTVDATPPTVSISSFSGSTTSNAPIIFRITFSKSVNYGLSAAQSNLTNSSISVLDITSAPTYTLTVYPAANGPVTLSVPANITTDVFGNGNTAAQPLTVLYTGAPMLNTPANGSVINTKLPIYSGTMANAGSISINVDNSVVTGTSIATGGSFSVAQPANQPLADGIHTVYARGTNSQQGNTSFGVSTTNTFTVDTTPPTVAISSPAVAAGGTTSTTPIPVVVTFSESVTGFLPSDVVLTNGTLTGGTVSGSGASYSFSVTPTSAGPVTVNVAANAAQDVATNGNTAAPTFSFTYTAPLAATLTTWTGAVSTDWFTAGNWSAGVPTTSLDVVIAGGAPRYPVVTAGAPATNSLAIEAGATLTQTGGTLNVTGDLTNDGTFTTTNASGTAGGTVAMGLADRVNGFNILGSSSIRFWNFSVAATTVQLSTTAGASVRGVLTLGGDFATQGNRLTLESTRTGDALVVNSGGAVLGNTAVVQRYIDPSLNPGAGYRHYAAPVTGSTVADLATPGFAPTVNAGYNTSATPDVVVPFPTVYGYDQSRLTTTSNYLSPFDKGWFSPTALTDPLTVGQGYTVNIGASQLVDFVGMLNNGPVSVNLARNTPNAPDAGWQFLGNPYPSPLDYSRVPPADRINLDAAIYVYQSTGQYVGSYRFYVNGIGGNPILPVAQGFFARVSSGQTSGTLNFRNSQRLTAPDATTFQRTTADARPQVQLELRGSTGPADAFYAYAENGATTAFDSEFDAIKLPNPTGLNLAGAATSGEAVAIDGRPAFLATTVLPLTVGVPAAGTYSLSAATLANLPAGLSAYLTDAHTGQTVSLAPGTSYSFNVTTTEATALISSRFQLVFRTPSALATATSLTAELVSVYPNPAHERFTVVLPGVAQATTVQAELLNALGQVVRQQSAALPGAGTQLTFDTAALATGVYTLRLQAGATTLAKRIMLH